MKNENNKKMRLMWMSLLLIIPVIFLLTYDKKLKEDNFTFDVYGAHSLSASDITQAYNKKLHEIASILLSADPLNNQQLPVLINAIISSIKNRGDFSYVNLSPILYPNDPKIHITLDIIETQDDHRNFSFLNFPEHTFEDPDHLLQFWDEYQKIGFNLIYKEKHFPVIKSCGEFHCLFGFDEQELKKYKKLFDNGVEKNKIQLLNILSQDRDEHRRATAAYLLAHLHSGSEVINDLTPFISDPSPEVRNNVMRVIASTLDQTRIDNFPIDRVITALDYPTTTDRNKALLIIDKLVHQSPFYNDYILNHAAANLLSELRMFQPNVHLLAYDILKIVTKKNFGERDYNGWTTTIDSMIRFKNAENK